MPDVVGKFAKAGYPEAYAKGYETFMGRQFSVNEQVYVPDKETEIMVNGFLKDLVDGASVLDVGTGSGNIAITVAKEKPKVKIYACDISQEALEVAKQNAGAHQANIKFIFNKRISLVICFMFEKPS